MKVQTRLGLYSSLVFGIIFAIISALTYGLYYNSLKKSIDNNLARMSQVVALFFLEEDELNKEEFVTVKEQFEEFVSNSYYQIYSEYDTISYGMLSGRIPSERLNEIREKESLSFTSGDFYCHGIYYEDNQGNFVVVAREKRTEMGKQLQALLWILVVGFVIGMLAVILLNRWIANIAYRPFRLAIMQVKNLSTHNLNVPIRLPDTQDELKDLITTFNDLLAKISEAFVIQKNFVRYVSHEFKTPLAAMQGNLEVFSIKERSPQEYQQLSQKLVGEIRQLEGIINTLIVISDLGSDSVVNEQVRLDELIWEIIAKLPESYEGSKVSVNIDILPEDESLLTVLMDKTQLFMAFFNIIENAVKFSKDRTANIRLYKEKGKLHVSVEDHGIGIPADQLDSISRPFYRAENANRIQGSGIGLSIALRILEKNKIPYSIRSVVNRGTEIVWVM